MKGENILFLANTIQPVYVVHVNTNGADMWDDTYPRKTFRDARRAQSEFAYQFYLCGRDAFITVETLKMVGDRVIG